VEVKGEQASGVTKPVASQSTSETNCQQQTELSKRPICAARDYRPVRSPTHANCLLRMCHHIVIELYNELTLTDQQTASDEFSGHRLRVTAVRNNQY
jgi:hypothetical protein